MRNLLIPRELSQDADNLPVPREIHRHALRALTGDGANSILTMRRRKEQSMLWQTSVITGYAIKATDGGLGTVSDLLFEDVTWAVRWIEVDTGHWPPGRKIILPLSALGTPDGTSRHFPVKLTMQQVKDSPDVDTARPVSRQTEGHIFDYYGADPYWLDALTPISNAIATPFAGPLQAPDLPPRDIESAARKPSKGDPHLRSVAAITGYEVDATDGDIGRVQDFLVDDDGWSIRYLVVDTGSLLPGKRVVISPRSVRKIDWASESIYVNADRRKVKDAPFYDASATMDRAYDEAFRRHYGIDGVAA